jgi:hypothetical protein
MQVADRNCGVLFMFHYYLSGEAILDKSFQQNDIELIA